MPKTLNIISRKNTDTNFYRTNPYSDNDIDTIPDPEGSTAHKQITSIPSPFARVDLFKTAFRFVSEHARTRLADLDGATIHHKLVSEMLDMAQIFFNFDALKQDESKHLRILVWDRSSNLSALLNSSNPKHRLLGETMRLYLEQDAAAYNFDRWQSVYMISYDYKIIGGTSPASLFFTTANDLSFVDIKLGNDKLFDDDYSPLYKRDIDFQKYIYLLFKTHANELHESLKFVKDYLDINLLKLQEVNPTQHTELRRVIDNTSDMQFKNDYFELDTGIAGQVVQVLGVPLRRKKVDKGSVQQSSDFVIASTKCLDPIRPLVLQNGFNKPNFAYVANGLWVPNTPVPYADSNHIDKRKLPGQNEIYPYLTVDDFLEPYLIRLIYPINKDKFFDGNLIGATTDEGFLLPIKRLYNKYFDFSTLTQTLPNGQKVFQLEKRVGGGVAAILRIPISKTGEFVVFERLYYPPVSEYEIRKPNISATTNEGAIVECRFGVTVSPFVRTITNHHYRVAVVDADVLSHTINNEYALSFFNNSNADKPQTTEYKQRSDKRVGHTVTTKFYVLSDTFEAIEVNNGIASGLLLPIFPPLQAGNARFRFAADFGTSNSHIEVSKDNARPVPFEITAQDMQLATTYKSDQFFDVAPEIKDLVLHELMPDIIGKTVGSEFSFPQRTAIAENRTLNHAKEVVVLADMNIPFFFEKRLPRPNSLVNTDLKWSNYTQEQDDQNRVALFIDQLVLMMRNKVLANGGDLARTELTWFYPSSMTPMRRNKLRNLWADSFAKYIAPIYETPDGKGANFKSISESIAPYYHYSYAESVSSSAYPAVCIDIGGGTTDVVAYMSNKPVFLTSFRFAGNAIFGDAFRGSAMMNGFVQRYKPKVEKILRENNMTELLQIMEGLGDRSADIVSFFFSLQSNKKLQEAKVPLPFSQWLSDDADLKVVFLTFYAAIIYHVAKLMKKAGLGMPRYICFGGNGSKMISIIDPSSSLPTLTTYTKLVFEKLYDVKYGVGQTENLTLKKATDPKEITCKGGLYESNDVNVEDIMLVLLGTEDETIVNNFSQRFPINQVKYTGLNNDVYQSICTEVRKFVDLFFDINNQLSYNRYFGINASKFEEYKALLTQDLLQYLLDGLEMKQKQDLANDPNADIEESLFFYPLIGALNVLASKVVGG